MAAGLCTASRLLRNTTSFVAPTFCISVCGYGSSTKQQKKNRCQHPFAKDLPKHMIFGITNLCAINFVKSVLDMCFSNTTKAVIVFNLKYLNVHFIYWLMHSARKYVEERA